MATRKRASKKQSTRGKSARKSARKSANKSARKSAKKSAKKSASKSTKKKSTRKAAKRTLIAPKGDKRYVRRSKRGRFKESDDVSRSLSNDRRKQAGRKAPRGQGDKGD